MKPALSTTRLAELAVAVPKDLADHVAIHPDGEPPPAEVLSAVLSPSRVFVVGYRSAADASLVNIAADENASALVTLTGPLQISFHPVERTIPLVFEALGLSPDIEEAAAAPAVSRADLSSGELEPALGVGAWQRMVSLTDGDVLEWRWLIAASDETGLCRSTDLDADPVEFVPCSLLDLWTDLAALA